MIRRSLRLGLAITLLGAVLFAFGASPALAQELPTDVVGGVSDTVGDVTDTVEDVTAPIDDTVDAVDDVATGVNETVKKAAGKVGGGVEDVTGSLGDTTGGLSGGAAKTVKRLAPTEGSVTVGKSTVGASALDSHVKAGVTRAQRSGSDTPSGDLSGLQALETETQRDQSSVLQNLAETLTAVAKQLAFPTALILLVGGFLMMHGRVDRKDPKLALAPIDSAQEYISFK
jgi:hypothetical protein